MIEILEINKNIEKQQAGIQINDSRVFILRDGNDQLGSLHFETIDPHFVKLTMLEVSESTNLTQDIILDGLLRTACHTFYAEKIYGIVAEVEKCREHNLTDIYFEPMAEIGDDIAIEIEAVFMSGQGQYCLMKTDMIYKGCCKGV